MAQSATKERALLGIEPFWDKPTLEPPLRWDRWQIMLKLAIMAKEGISIDTLLDDPPDKVTLPPEPIYEADVENSKAQSERDRRTRNEQLKNSWLNRCQKIELVGILCGEKPWKYCDNKAVSLIYLSLGIEGSRIFGSQEPNIQIDRVTTKILWDCLDGVFTKQRNITFDRYTFLTRKQMKGEPVEKFYGCLRELSLNCDLGSHEESIIRDVFFANMQDGEIQRELLKETRTAKKALEVAMNIEMGIQNQLKISGTSLHNTTNEILSQSINSVQGSWNRTRAPTKQFVKPTICPNCGYGWTPSHRQNCPARGKSCKNCGIANHFAKVCRKPKQPSKQKPRVNYVDDSVSEAATVGTSATAAEQVNNISKLLQQKSIYDANYDSDYDDYNDNCVAAISIKNDTREVEPVNLGICVGNTYTKALVDSGSVCTIVNKSLADTVVSDCNESYWVQSPEIHDLKTFSNDIIKIVGVINTSIKCNDWIATGADVTVVEDGHRPIIGRDLFPKLGFSVIQLKQVVNIDQNQCPIKRQISFDFPDLITRVGKSLKHSLKSTFHDEFTPTHQKGRRVPINLQPLVNIELKKLLDEKHIIKLNSCSDKNFISPIVITVKRDKTVKLALDSKILNKSIHKNKYQMPNIDNLIDTIQQNLNTSASQETAYYSTLDLKYAYSQLKLDPKTAQHCNFNIISGEKTGTYRFITGFYVLTDMPAAFQKVMDYTLVRLQNTYCFLDDIIVVSRGSKDDHLKLIYKCLKKLDEDNLRINLPKCHFAKTEIEWLGHKFSQSGIAPLESKTAAIASLPAPKNLKQLRSFLGSVHYLGKFIPNLSQLCHPLRPLLKKNTKFIWNTEDDTHFQAIKDKVANTTENTHYNPHLETRIKCDASRAGLGAALEQRSPSGWHTVAFASRFVNSNEE